ncbi:MAG: hypothetical protein QGG88_09060 [Gammaproteobacteria bacterium]|jgi:hypothetical protein|nr:hypothetical protein [Gammaproteobacteria bacterium]
MTKPLIIAAMVGAMALVPSAYAGLMDSIATLNFPTKESVAYKVDVYGYDARVYEFIPEHNKDYVCIMLATGGNSNAVQMECIPRKQ